MRVTRLRVAILSAAIGLTLVSVSTARAIIEIQRGISGITLGMAPARVKAGLGYPNKVSTHPSLFTGRLTEYLYTGGLKVVFTQGRVIAVAVTGPTDRTANGIGVGSTEKASDARCVELVAKHSPASAAARLARSCPDARGLCLGSEEVA